MGCQGPLYAGNSACCPDPQIVVEQQCMNFLGITGTAGTVLWTDNTGFNQTSVSAFVDPNADPAVVTVSQPAGTTSFGPIPPGDTVAQTFASINSVAVGVGATGSTSGKVCLTTYRKIYP